MHEYEIGKHILMTSMFYISSRDYNIEYKYNVFSVLCLSNS